MVTKAPLVQLEAKPGKEDAVEDSSDQRCPSSNGSLARGRGWRYGSVLRRSASSTRSPIRAPVRRTSVGQSARRSANAPTNFSLCQQKSATSTSWPRSSEAATDNNARAHSTIAEFVHSHSRTLEYRESGGRGAQRFIRPPGLYRCRARERWWVGRTVNRVCGSSWSSAVVADWTVLTPFESDSVSDRCAVVAGSRRRRR